MSGLIALGSFVARQGYPELEVKLDPVSGTFSTQLGDIELAEDSLRSLLGVASKTMEGHRLNAPMIGLDGRRGVIRGFHAGNHDALVTWEDGSKGRLSGHDYILSPKAVSDERLAEIRAAVAARREAEEAMRLAGIHLADLTKEGRVRAQDFLTEAIGTDLFDRRWEPGA